MLGVAVASRVRRPVRYARFHGEFGSITGRGVDAKKTNDPEPTVSGINRASTEQFHRSPPIARMVHHAGSVRKELQCALPSDEKRTYLCRPRPVETDPHRN